MEPHLAIPENANPLRWIRERFARQGDSEPEQAIIRLVIVSIIMGYTQVVCRSDHQIDSTERTAIWLIWAFILFSIGILVAIARKPEPSPVRRFVGMHADILCISSLMYLTGEQGAVFFVILLWVPFGNGFRYGRKYLFVATLLSFLSFAVLFRTSSFWKSIPDLSAGLLISLIALPAYVSSLLKKLTEAIRRAEDANRAKNQFLANMSHEMRTPLSGILGMIELMRSTPQTAEQEDYSNTIQASAQTLLFLIEDVLDISKIEAGKISVETADFDLHALVKSTMAILTPQARQKGLGIYPQIPPRVPFLLRGDPLLIRQVLLNLVSNAVKFTEAGEVCLRAEQVRETPKSVLLRFEVSDTGIGIPPEAQKRIFERFTQADDSITRRYGGSGLGTTIAKQLVELMGGEIGLRSEPGKGTTFWFTLELEKQQSPASQATGTSILHGSRVLVVSSDGNSSYLLRKHLASWGAEAVVVDKAAQAFSPLISAANDGKPYQVAIIVETDLDMDPADLAKALQSVRLIRNVQLVLVSGEENEPDLSVIAKQGFAAAVGASIDKTLLFNAVHFVRPCDEETGSVPSLASRYRQKKEEERRGLRILVAEDNLTNQKVIARILERAGHQAQLVMNGEEALDAMEKDTFDLVLLDLHMPVMGGLEAAKLYRFTRAGSFIPPLVALTADATRESRKACEEAGFDHYLTKPVEMKKLLEILDSLSPPGRKGQLSTTSDKTPATGTAPAESDRVATVIDPTTLDELAALGGKGDFLDKLIRIFLETGEQKIDSIEKAIRTKNFGQVADLAHALKGSAGQLGAVTLKEICHLLSRAGPAAFTKDRQKTVEDLKEEFERVKSALVGYLRLKRGWNTPIDEGGSPGGRSGVHSSPQSSRSR